MSTARLPLAVVGETRPPLRASFFSSVRETFRSPRAVHGHTPEPGQ